MKRLVELHHEVVFEILRHPAAVARGVADDFLLFGKHLYIRTFIVGIYYDKRAVISRKCEAEHGRTLRGRDFGGHAVVGKEHAVIVRLGHFGLMAEEARALVLVEHGVVCARHDGKLAVVVHPRARLVGLLEAAQAWLGVDIGPAVAHAACLRSPEVHAPGHGDCRICVAVRHLEVRNGAYERVHVVDRRNGGCRQRGSRQYRCYYGLSHVCDYLAGTFTVTPSARLPLAL